LQPSPPNETDWRTSLKVRYGRRRWRAALWILALFLVCLTSSGLAGWVWTLLIDDSPPWDLLGGALFLAEAPVFIWLARKGPLSPLPGRQSEEIAADAFFHDAGPRP
jgi:hypothetical protein